MSDELFNSEMKSQVAGVVETLNTVDNGFIVDEVSHHFLSITHNTDVSEIVVRGNPAGLIHLAKQILRVAISDHEGYHECFDECGMVDTCDIPLVVSLSTS